MLKNENGNGCEGLNFWLNSGGTDSDSEKVEFTNFWATITNLNDCVVYGGQIW